MRLASARLIALPRSACAEQAEYDQTGPDSCPSRVDSWELVSIQETASALSGEFESDPDYPAAPTPDIFNKS